MDVLSLLRYSDNSRATLYQILAAHPHALPVPIQTASEYKTIAQLIAHMIGAEQRWTFQRLEGGERPAQYEAIAPTALDALYADWNAVRSRLHANVATGDLDRPITFTLPHWNNYTETLRAEGIVFHVIHHQSWHMAQISMALQLQNIEPPNFDYVFLHEKK